MKSEFRQSISLLEKHDFIRWNEELWDNGCYVWLPRGAKLKRLFYRNYTDRLREYGYHEMQLPRLVPEDVLDRVADTFMDFRESVYWTSTREDEEYEHAPYYLNSTSDPVLNYFLGEEIDSRSDLPFRVYMREQLFRPHGSTSTRPFIDSDENVDVVESYSIRSTREGSLKDFSKAFSLLETFIEDICLAWYRVERPEWGNKPVADRVHSLQTLLPDFECSTRVGTVYHHDQTFSRIFDVAYPEKDGPHHVHQTAFGFGERTLFTMLNQHTDRHGLRLPPIVAPTQVAIIPFTRDERERARQLASELEIRTDVDKRFNQSYQKRLGRYLESGVPLRVGIKTGEHTVEVSRRDTLKRFTVEPERLVVKIDEYLAEVTAGLQADADSLLAEATTRATESRQFDDALANNQLIQLPWCGSAACGKQLEADNPGEFLGECVEEAPVAEDCLVCEESATAVGFYGRRSPSP